MSWHFSLSERFNRGLWEGLPGFHCGGRGEIVCCDLYSPLIVNRKITFLFRKQFLGCLIKKEFDV